MGPTVNNIEQHQQGIIVELQKDRPRVLLWNCICYYIDGNGGGAVCGVYWWLYTEYTEWWRYTGEWWRWLYTTWEDNSPICEAPGAIPHSFVRHLERITHHIVSHLSIACGVKPTFQFSYYYTLRWALLLLCKFLSYCSEIWGQRR